MLAEGMIWRRRRLTEAERLNDRWQKGRRGCQGIVHAEVNDASYVNPVVLECFTNVGYFESASLLALQHADLEIPMLTEAPTSPLIPRFILSRAIARSDSLKNVVDSGRFGRNISAMTPERNDGMPSIMNKSRQSATDEWMCCTPKAISPPKAPATAANPNQ